MSDPPPSRREPEIDRTIQIFLRLRKAIGVLAIILPVLLPAVLYLRVAVGLTTPFAWGDLPTSISGYYHTDARDEFVGTLIAVAIFLFAYLGTEGRLGRFQDCLANAAGAFALGVALAPVGKESEATDAVEVIHYACAGALFVCLVLFAVFVFPATNDEFARDASPVEVRSALLRRRFYVTCAVVMVLCVLALFLHLIWGSFGALMAEHWPKAFFWFEAFALMAFGASWLVKGGVLQRTIERAADAPLVEKFDRFAGPLDLAVKKARKIAGAPEVAGGERQL